MDSVCKELQEVKLELGNIKDEYRIKTELLENLRKANDDQAVRNEEAKLRMEKLAHELSTKEGEITESRHLYEDVKQRLQETETSLKHASFINEKLRVDSAEKVQKLEEENRKLISGLDEATLNTSELERQLCASREEVAGLKVLVSDAQKKCLEAEQKNELKKALSSRDDAIMKLEEKCIDIQDQLKWKTEHFEHLKEAHKLLQENLQSSKQEFALEKTTLLQEISSLQNNLDTQARLNENLQSELRMCNQALAHEESRRRTLEIQLSESKLCFENVLGEFNEAKSKIENLSIERDEKVAALRNALSMKNAHVKEMEYRVSHLEQENKELLCSVKELQEAQIGRKKPDSSFIKLRNKLKDLEKTHNSCSIILEEREAEWNMKMEKMIGQVTRCEFELKTKTEEINQLKLQAENCQSSVDISVQEMSILLMVLKSAYSEVYSELKDLELVSETEKEEVVKQEIRLLRKKLEALKTVENKNMLLENELDKCQKMLDKSVVSQLLLEEHVALIEASSKEMGNQVVGLEKEKIQLERQLKTREEHVASMEASSKQMMNEVVGLQKEKTQLEMQLKTSKEHVILIEEQMMSEVVGLQKEKSQLEKELNTSKENVTLMKNKVVGLEKEKIQLEKELKTREENAVLMEASSKEMMNQLVGLQKEKIRLENEMKSREEDIVLIEASSKQMMNVVVGLQEEKTQLERELKTRDENAVLMEASSKEMMNQLVGLQKEKIRLENEMKSREEDIVLIEASSKQMMNELVGLQEEKTQLERELKTIEENVALMEGSSKQMMNEVVGLQKEKSQLEKQLKTIEEKAVLMEASAKQMKNEVVGLQKEKNQLEMELKTSKEHVALMEASIKQMKNEVVGLQEEKTQLEKTIEENAVLIEASTEQMKNEVVGLQKEKNQLEMELKTSKEHVALMEASNKQMKNEVVVLQKEKTQLEKTIEENAVLMEASTKQMKNELAGLQKEKTLLQRQLKTSEEHAALMEASSKQMRNEVIVLQEENTQLEQAMEKLYTDVSVSSSSETFEMLTSNGALREALINAKYFIATEAEEKNNLVSALEKEISNMQSERLHSEKSVNYSQTRVKELEALLEHKALEMKTLKGEKECLVAYVEGVYKQINGFQEDDVKLMGMLKKMQGHCEEDDSFSNKGKIKGVLDRKVCPLRELN